MYIFYFGVFFFQNGTVSEEAAERMVNSTYPIIHAKMVPLLQDFLALKKVSPYPIERWCLWGLIKYVECINWSSVLIGFISHCAETIIKTKIWKIFWTNWCSIVLSCLCLLLTSTCFLTKLGVCDGCVELHIYYYLV